MSDDKDTMRVVAECVGHTHVVRRRGDAEEEGVLTDHQEGKPIQPDHEYVKLRPRKSEVGVYDVVLSHKGPSRANTPAYRRGYERIFGTKKLDATLN